MFASPTGKIYSLQIMLQVSAVLGWHIRTIDVTGAYLNADLPEDTEILMWLGKEVTAIWMEANPDKQVYVKNGRMLVSIKKCLYGLRESSKEWYKLISSVLKIVCELISCDVDTCLYKYNGSNGVLFALLYVDDIILFYDKTEMYESFISSVKSRFQDITESVEDTVSFLGMSIKKTSEGILVNQTDVVMKLLKTHLTIDEINQGMKLPKITRSDKDAGKGEASKDEVTKGLSMVMGLMYVALRTRPDLLYMAVELASRVQNKYSGTVDELRKVYKYVASTYKQGIVYSKDADLKLTVMVDASLGNGEGRKSHTGIGMWLSSTFNTAAFYAKSAVQRIVAVHSTEAEVQALYDALNMAIWMREILRFIGNPRIDDDIYIVQDNEATVLKMNCPREEYKMREGVVELKFLKCRGLVQETRNKIVVSHVMGEVMWADTLTKYLGGDKFLECSTKLMGEL